MIQILFLLLLKFNTSQILKIERMTSQILKIKISFLFANLLIINILSAQSKPTECKMVSVDSMKYAINERGDTLFRAQVPGENLRYVSDSKSSRILNVQGETIYEERQPEYPTGQNEMFRFLATNIRYPRTSREDGAQGTVFVQFTVDIDGSLVDVHVKTFRKKFKAQSEEKQKKEEKRIAAKSYKDIEDEAVRVVKLMPKWKPGMQQNKLTRMAYTMPIKFSVE